MEQIALNVDTSNLLIAMPVLAAAGALGGFFPPLVMGAAYDAAVNSYFNGQMLFPVTAAARGGTFLVCGGKKSLACRNG